MATTPTPPRRRRSPARLLALAAASVAAVLLVGTLISEREPTVTRPVADRIAWALVDRNARKEILKERPSGEFLNMLNQIYAMTA